MTIRLVISFLAAFALAVLIGSVYVPWLRKIKAGQEIKEIGPNWHKSKAGTPTMGGVIFIVAVTAVVFSLGFPFIREGELGALFVLLFSMFFGAIGFLDDYEKLKKKQNLGLSARAKFILQLAVAVTLLYLLRLEGYLTPSLYVPFWGVNIDLPEWLYFLLAAFIVVGTVNSVNLTDGLDGLAASVSVPVFVFYTAIAFAWGSRFNCLGVFAAALYARENTSSGVLTSSILTEAELSRFAYSSRSVICKGCTSHCNVNILTFADGRKFISGNKCEKGAGLKPSRTVSDVYTFKYESLLSLPDGAAAGTRGTVGLPLQLVMYEQLPLWVEFFEQCGFRVVLSEKSSRALYFKGQHTVASDTACYPAKLMHGHIESLLDKGVDFIFYPCESYNLDEHDSANHYNCPVVAYYPELLKANNERLTRENFIMPYLDLNSEKATVHTLTRALGRYKLPASLVKRAFRAGISRMQEFHARIVEKGREILAEAEREEKQVIILAGRPYHADPEINHGINKLLTSLGIAVLSEDSIFEQGNDVKVNVLNQWTYHARLYRAAEYATRHRNVNLVQLVSFGCGIDAITTDEVRHILESKGKLYTQIKIDEITGLGVVKIRLRSLLAAIEESGRGEDDHA